MRIKKFVKYLFLFSIVLSISCSGDQINQISVPENLLNRQQMADVLCDIQISEAAVAQKNYIPDSANRTNAGYYNFIFLKHKISKDDFEKSYHYYLSTPDEMDSIYAKVIENLSSRESVLRGLEAKKVQNVKIDTSAIISIEAPVDKVH